MIVKMIFFLLLLIGLNQINNEGLKSVVFLIKITAIFFAMIILFNDFTEEIIIKQMVFVLERIKDYIPFIKLHSDARMISVIEENIAVSFFLDYECTGIVEILVFLSLVFTYPMKNKILLGTIGYLYLFTANIIRIILIVTIIYYFGRDSLFIAHSIIARIVYFTITITLYYKVFTENHLKEQKVGDL